MSLTARAAMVDTVQLASLTVLQKVFSRLAGPLAALLVAGTVCPLYKSKARVAGTGALQKRPSTLMRTFGSRSLHHLSKRIHHESPAAGSAVIAKKAATTLVGEEDSNRRARLPFRVLVGYAACFCLLVGHNPFAGLTGTLGGRWSVAL